LNTEVSQGSVATRLRCDEIFNDHFVIQSLLSLKVKKIENLSTFAKGMDKNSVSFLDSRGMM